MRWGWRVWVAFGMQCLQAVERGCCQVEIISRVILLKSIQAVSKGEAKPKVAIANRQDLRGGRRDSKRLAPAKPECGEEEAQEVSYSGAGCKLV